MSYGINVQGIGNRLVVDQNYSNYVLIASGSISVSGVGGNHYVGNLSLPAGYSRHIFLFRPPVGRSISYWGTKVYAYGTSGFSLPYKILVPLSQVGNAGVSYGIRVWDTSGNLVFDSGHGTLDTISTYSYVGTSEPIISAGYNDWLGVSTYGATTLYGMVQYQSQAGGIYLEKLSNGNLESHTLPYPFYGPGQGSTIRIANNCIYVNRCALV